MIKTLDIIKESDSSKPYKQAPGLLILGDFTPKTHNQTVNRIFVTTEHGHPSPIQITLQAHC